MVCGASHKIRRVDAQRRVSFSRAVRRPGQAASYMVRAYRVLAELLLVVCEHEGGLQVCRRLELGCLLRSLRHELVSGLDRTVADGEDRHLRRSRVEDGQSHDSCQSHEEDG